jgi:HK97 family phage portal protein
MGLLDMFRPKEAAAERNLAQAPPKVHAFGDLDYFHDLKDPRLADFVRGFEGPAGMVVNSESALRAAAVYGCVRLLSGAVATLPLDIKRKVGPNRLDAEELPLWNVIRRRPNRYMKPARFKRMLQTHILLRGNAYCLIVRDLRGQVIELLPLHPDRVEPKQDAGSLKITYEYTPPDGAKVYFPQEKIFHLMGMTHDGVKGMSVLSYARETIGMSLATARHGSSFFRNGTNVGSILTHPKTLGEEAADSLRDSLEKYRGADSANRTLVLEEDMKFERLGMSSVDAQFVETMVQSRTEIAMFFGVPPHMIGDTEKNTSWGTGIEALASGFVAFTLEDWLTEWEDAVNTDLIGETQRDVYARFNRSALVRGDYRTRWDGYVKGLQWGVYSPDDILAKEDENPRADGKGGQYYTPPNTAGAPADGVSPGNQGDNRGNPNVASQAA